MPDQQQPPTEQPAGAPEFEGAFDAERAGRLVAALRAEVRDLKAQLGTAEAASAESSGALTAAEQRATAAERALYIERARHAHNLPERVVEFLTGDTEEEITAKAERLASLGKPTASDLDQASPVTRPEPALVPGHGSDTPAAFSPHAVAAAARTIGEAR